MTIRKEDLPVDEILNAYKSGVLMRPLAMKYKVSVSTIFRIVHGLRGKKWGCYMRKDGTPIESRDSNKYKYAWGKK